ncbi:heterokaryon incompatibility protein-domain-containing protein [Xylariaceae sp. FL1651]|nr:heterokaryon incompatibility protein-domain-containing protein [Xylariaceae sp. FL1651]
MYQYSLLDESKDEIRLLELYSGDFNDDINCSIRHATLASTLEYTALSYTWGDPKIRKAISVDGQVLEVTVNLFDALRHLRDPQGTQTLWVDAVCINQGDLDERSKQVLRMRDIYTFAKTVEVWLGLTGDTDCAAMELVKSLGATVPDPEEPLANGFSEYGQAFLDIFECAEPKEVRALSQLFKRPWWTRVWVVQELSLANQQAAIVRCGKASVPWLSFLVAAYAIESSWFIVEAIVTSVFPDDKVDSFNNGIRMAQCRRVDPTHPPYALLELLHQHRDCESTDPKDKVYGLLGLSGDAEDIGITPNYGRSPEEIFTDLFKKHVLATKSLDMICAVRFPKKFDSLPSWVPDWSVDQTVPGICINDRYVGGNDFAGSPIAHFQRYATSGISLPQVSFLGMQMSAAGVCFDSIASVAGVDEGMAFENLESFGRADDTGKSASDSDTFNEWLNMILDSPIWDSIAARYGKDDVIDAFCRTLVGNRNNRMMKPPDHAETDSEAERGDSEDGTPSENRDTFDSGGNTREPEEQEEHDKEDAMSVSSDGPVLFSPHEMLDMTVDGFRSCIQVAWGKRFAIFDGGYMGIIPRCARVGDVVAVLLGCTMPLILRRNQGSHFTVVGECYVHGAMDGEVLQESPTEVLIFD